MDKKSVAKNYRFLIILLCCMVAGALVGWFFPAFSHGIAFLGKVFINLMFCIVVPWCLPPSPAPLPIWRAASEPVRSWAPPSSPL